MIHNFVVFIAALFLFAGCRPPEKDGAHSHLNSSVFNATNVYDEIKALTAITPRNSGSPGAKKAAEHLLSRLRATGIDASPDEFEEETPAGQMLFRNVIGVLPGRPARRSLGVGGNADGKPADSPLRSALAKRGAWIVLGAHYDAKSGIADNFQGANDSASGACLLLELARVIKNSSSSPMNFLFAFFDGEECVSRYGKNDGLHGSRRLAEQLVKDGRSAKVRAVIILDMVGDRDLSITIPRNSALSLVSALFAAAEAEGTRARFRLWSNEILDDHQPFLSAGMPAIDIIDFEYGSARGQNDYWHTPQDTIDKLSVQSLEIVGKTVLRLLDDLMPAKSVAVKGGKSFE